MSSFSAKIAKHAPALKRLAEDLRKLDEYMLCLDLVAGISDMKRDLCLSMPAFGEELSISSSKNLFLASPQPISFSLGSDARCSILTGANSGGKTTLLEHIIQLVSMAQMGLPVSGTSKLPVFSEIYYFAKSKGSAGKGAFETLLSTLSKISPGGSTLILADEIEAVTEPGVAGRIICATCSYYIEKGCFMVIATHLGHDIIRELPERARVDGIEAKGLDENNELIVDHNPVLGRLANSTPELIIERLAKTGKSEYYRFIHTYLSR